MVPRAGAGSREATSGGAGDVACSALGWSRSTRSPSLGYLWARAGEHKATCLGSCGPELAGRKLPLRVWPPELVTRSQLLGCQRNLLKDECPRIGAVRGRQSTEEQERDALSSAVPALTLQSLHSQSLKPHPPTKARWSWGSAQVSQRRAKCGCRIN